MNTLTYFLGGWPKGLWVFQLVQQGLQVLPGKFPLEGFSDAFVTSSGGKDRIVSDTAFKYGNVETPHPLGIQESMEECHVAYARFRREASVFVPLYDPEVLERFPGGRIA